MAGLLGARAAIWKKESKKAAPKIGAARRGMGVVKPLLRTSFSSPYLPFHLEQVVSLASLFLESL
jgi:hypothetical protein